MDIQLSVGMANNPRTRAIFDGRVKPDGIDLVCTPGNPGEIFWRQLKGGDWDVSEMSFSSLMIARARGDDRFVGLPIFTTRHFFHTMCYARKDSGINSPADFKGKRVGVSTVGSVTGWIVGEVSRQKGWGYEGIPLVAIGDDAMAIRLKLLSPGFQFGLVETAAQSFQVDAHAGLRRFNAMYRRCTSRRPAR
mgnify:CR=1 FL=1